MSIHTRGTDPHEPLEAVLRAATVPGHPEELAGEHMAVAAFRAAAGSRRRSWLARVLTVKVLVVGGVAVSTGVVLAAVGGALPLPGVGPSDTPPADQPSITRPAVVPAETPQDRPTSTPGPSTPPSSAEPCDNCGDRDAKEDEDKDRRGPGDKGDDKHEQQSPPDEQPDNTDRTTQPSFSRTETPDSPAQGAVTAVPPNGVESPSPGG